VKRHGGVVRRVLVGLVAATLVVAAARPSVAAPPEAAPPEAEPPSPAVAAPPEATPPEVSPSIYKISPWIDGAIIVGANAVTVGFYAFGNGLIKVSCPCDRSEVNSFDRKAIGNHSDLAYDIGTATVGLALVAPVALDIWDLRRFRPVLEDVLVFGEALSLSGAFFTIAKFSTSRPFPRTYEGTDTNLVDDERGYRSFYSGHTALTFTALSVASMTIARRYDHWEIPWVVTALVGSSVAVEMVAAGWHFPTDTIAGAAFGTAVGIAVPFFHYSELPVRPTVTVSPGGNGPALALVGTWR
jgi:membrane-associated phospholipid phosphatase